MKKIGLLLSLLLILLFAEKNVAQILVCNDLVFVSLDETCTHTLVPDEILEGIDFSDCVVELDKTVPYGNGPWEAPLLSAADIGKTYQFRVRHTPSGNLCWGNVKTEDKLQPVLECASLSTVDLNGAGPVTVLSSALSITAFDGCGAMTLTPANHTFDCADLGANVVQLTATDLSGNTATCKHTILVTNSGSCDPCVSACPQSVVVSFEEGNLNLLSAFQANNDAPFAGYGNPVFNSTCSQVDSLYSIDYEVGTAGQSWFDRQWVWLSSTGQPYLCKQTIAFPTTHKITIQGRIFIDTNDDCISDAGEQGVNHYVLELTKTPSGLVETIYAQPDGTYSVDLEFSVLDVSAELHLVLPPNLNSVCPSALNIPNVTSNPNLNFDIGLQSDGDCPRMQVDIGNLFTRRCATNFFKIQYCNVGLDTAYGAFVTLNLDPLISLQTADHPYTVSGPEELYTFQVGDVPPFFCGTIVVHAMVDCNAVLGQTVCNEVNIYPDAPCNGAWQGALIEANAVCAGDSVNLELTNKGPQNMTIPLNYIVVEDFIMYKDGPFQLNAGETTTIKVPANGATWRIEADQVPGYPVLGYVSAAIEGCGGLNTPGLINIFGHSDNAMHYDQDCGEIVASCDPNDKNAVPIGIGDQHIIRANEPIEYKIRFQNTGTDTAFQVVVVDTLPAMLDFNTLELGASSHPYRLKIYPGGILHFVFDPIALPDSNVNEIASHGYLKFRIAQKPNLADGTRIENTVAIYFDENAPVFTNTAFHTIGYPFLLTPPLSSTTQTLQPSCNGTSDAAIYIAAVGGVAPYTFTWNDPSLQGDSLTGLAAGIYDLTLTDSHGSELLQSFEITDPAAIVLTMGATATLGNDNSGTATVNPTGGTGAYTYLWNTGTTTANLNGLAAGTYTILVTDENACTQSSSVAVLQTVLPLLFSTQIVDPLCFNGSDGAISVTATGGLTPYTFAWSDPNLQGASLSGLVAGTYQLSLTDSYGAVIVESFELKQPEPVLVNTNVTNAVGNQNNGSASALASGGTSPYTYQWSNGGASAGISDLTPGSYTVVVTDAHGCTQSETVSVGQTILPLLYSALVTNPACFGAADGSISLTVTGGLEPYTYQWSDPNIQGNLAFNLPVGTYFVSLTDNNGTQLVESFQLVEPTEIEIAMSATPAIGAQNNGTATALANGGTGNLTYLWSNGAITESISGLSAGTYSIVVTDANGCTVSSSIVVEQLVSVKDPGVLSNILVWPNPAQDLLMVDLQQVLSDLVRLDVLSADGRLLRQFQNKDLQAQLRLPLENGEASGFILLVLYGHDGGIYTEKVMIKK